MGRRPKGFSLVDGDELGSDDDEQEAVPEAPAKKTLGDVIAGLYAKPRKVQFIATRAPGYAIAIGNHYFKFVKNELITEDPEAVALLMASERYGFDYTVLDRELMDAQ